jgi:RHS repeat-associated protein
MKKGIDILIKKNWYLFFVLAVIFTGRAYADVPVASITADPMTISSGGSTTLSWDVSNADSITIEPGLGGGLEPNDSRTVSLDATTTYTITATGSGGTNINKVTVTAYDPLYPPQIIDNTDEGFSTEGSWSLINSDECYSGDCLVAPVGADYSLAIWSFPVVDGVYELSAMWSADPDYSDFADYYVANNGNYDELDNIVFDHRSRGGQFNVFDTRYAVEAGTLEVALVVDENGNAIADAIQIVRLGSIGEMEIQCYDDFDNDGDGKIDCEDSDCSTNYVCQAPTVTLTADPANIVNGQSSTLYFSWTNAYTVTLDHEIGNVSQDNNAYDSGSETVYPSADTTYTITATNAIGTTMASAKVSMVVGSVIHVPADFITLQGAIDAAVNGDTIIVANGTYKGAGNKNLVFTDKHITVKSANGPMQCTIDCESDGRGFSLVGSQLNSMEGAVISGFTITNGYSENGGGIYLINANPRVSNCRIINNTSTNNGGGVYIKNASPVITNCDISDNTAANDGGGLYIYWRSSPEVYDTYIAGNIGDRYGGGFYIATIGDNFTKFTNCMVTENTASQGGGFYQRHAQSILTLFNCTLADNALVDESIVAGVSFEKDGGKLFIRNSIVWPSSSNPGESRKLFTSSGAYPDIEYSNLNDDGAFGGEGNIALEPSFVGNGDYHLMQDSPCIDSGSATDAPDSDIDGEIRPLDAGVDIGADELKLSPVIVSFHPYGNQAINAGESTTLHWSTYNAESLVLEPGSITVGPYGPYDVSPSETTTYTLTATGYGETVSKNTTLTVCQPSTVEFNASAETIVPGEIVTLTWNTANIDNVTILPDIGSVESNGSIGLSPAQSTTYELIASTLCGDTPYTQEVRVIRPSPTVSFKAQSKAISPGGFTYLTWNTTNATSCSISPSIGEVDLNGSIKVSPTTGTIYQITVKGYNLGQSAIGYAIVTVSDLPSVNISATPNPVPVGDPVTLQWFSTDAVSCSIDPDVGGGRLNSYEIVSPSETTAYTITCKDFGDRIATDSVNVEPVSPNTVKAIISAQPQTVRAGQAATLSWSALNVDTCTIDPDVGSVTDSNNPEEVTPTQKTTYTISCTGPNGSASDAVEVAIVPEVSLTTDSDLIQSGGTTYLNWTSNHADTLIIEPGSLTLTGESGATPVSPETSTRYTITASGAGGSAEAHIRVFVEGSAGYDYGDPTPAEQAMLEAINWARLNPTAEAGRLGIDLFEGVPDGEITGLPMQPLAFNHKLLEAAGRHSQDMINQQYQSHDSLDGRSTFDRIQDAGYQYYTAGENIGSHQYNAPKVEEEFVLLAHDGLFLDEGVDGRGHRINILKEDFKEVGIGIATGAFVSYPHGYMVTCDFGASSEYSDSLILGVVYDDTNLDGLYSAGEGMPEVEITVIDNGIQTTTASAGGYAMLVPAGTYFIEARLADGQIARKWATIDDQNVKVDFLRSEFSASPPPIAYLIVTPALAYEGDEVTIEWDSLDAQDLFLEPGFGRVDPYDSITDVAPGCDRTYTISASGPTGASTQSATVTILHPPSITSFSATPDTVATSGEAILEWSTDNASTVSIEPGVGSVPADGTYPVAPTETTQYTLTATSLDNTQTTAVTTVTVAGAANHPEINFSVSPLTATINAGESATLTWDSTYATTVSISGIGEVDLDGNIDVTPLVTRKYTVTASGPGGEISEGIDVTVVGSVDPPEVILEASESTIAPGDPVTLTWSSTNAIKAFIDQGIGEVSVNNSTICYPEHSTPYTITVVGSAGTVSAEVMVEVNETPDPQPEGSFGASYEELNPSNASVIEYDPKRFSVVRGTVHDTTDTPLADVRVMVHGHPEYGSTLTDASGEYALTLEGGSLTTLIFEKTGLITAHRSVAVPWNDIANVETLQMTDYDTAATTFTLNGDPGNVVVHTSTSVSDEFGMRAVSVVLSGDNQVFLQDDAGNDLVAMGTFTLRATEFTTPAAMPAVLPPNSAFTYCTELAVDGAAQVRFDKPIPLWVDNFLGFAVGQPVPVGYYDRSEGRWVPSENGRVVKLLDTDDNGQVDALDATGDDQPDDLDGDGQVADEVSGLDDPVRFAPGATFWRVEVKHFTPWDLNWPYGPPEGAISPNPEGEPSVDGKCDKGDCNRASNSYTEERSRIFHEDIAVPGTGLTLHYASNRVPGYHHRIYAPASGADLPPNLKSIIAKVEVAGKKMEKEVPVLPDQGAEFIWDGLDFRGKTVDVPVNATIGIGFVYDAEYYEAGEFNQAFAQTGTQVTLDGNADGRIESIVWKYNAVTIYPHKGTLARGWTLSNHHQLSPVRPSRMITGDGAVIKNMTSMLTTFAGSNDPGTSPDGTPAAEAKLDDPSDVVADAAGNVYICESLGHRVVKVDDQGVLTTVAGIGVSGYNGDNIPATSAQLYRPTSLALDTAGNLYIAEHFGNRIRKVDRNGIITTVAGDGTSGFSGDGGPATAAQLYWPLAIAVDAAGNIYISDNMYSGVRKVDTNGIINTVVGTGEYGSSGDDGPAIDAQVSTVSGLAVDNQGNLYLSDFRYGIVRKVDTAGRITVFAGKRHPGALAPHGDGGPAVEAALSIPLGLDTDPEGNLYIADWGDRVVRKVDPAGIITTVAGSWTGGYDEVGDGTLPSEARLHMPQDVAVDPAGNLYIADADNFSFRITSNRILKVSSTENGGIQQDSGDFRFNAPGEQYITDSAGRHLRTVDPDTQTTLFTFDYDTDKQLETVTDRFGNLVQINRWTDGTYIEIVSPDDITTTLTIDANNDLKLIEFADNNFYEFDYDLDGLMVVEKDPNKNSYTHIFDDQGRLTDVTDEAGGHDHYDRYEYPNGDRVSVRDTAEGNLVSYRDHTDSTGAYTSTITNASGAVTLFSRAADGLSDSKTTPCGTMLSTHYGIDPIHKTQYAKEMTITQPSGMAMVTRRSIAYDDTDADGQNDLTTETVTLNDDLESTVYTHNLLQSQKVVTSPEGRTITTAYDPTTLLIDTVSIPGLLDTSYAYDARGRLETITRGDRTTTYDYDTNGNLYAVTDGEQHITTFDAYDAIGRLKGVLKADTGRIDYGYDPNGNLETLTTPGTVDHTFTYNAVNRRDGYQAPLSGDTIYRYDNDRRLTETEFPSGKKIINIYPANRLEQIQTPEGNIDIDYKCGDVVETLTKGTESITYGYDGSLVTGVTTSGTLNQSISYAHHDDFQVKDFTYAGVTETSDYDLDGLLKTAGGYTITRNLDNGLPETITGGSLDILRKFNGHAELDGQSITVGGNTAFQWAVTERDRTGRIKTKTETIDGATTTYVYGYDKVGRLETVTKDGEVVESYGYDLDGTRTSETNTLREIGGRILAYSDEDYLFTAGSVSYSYDLDGYLATRTDGVAITTYDYSSRGELLQVELPDGRTVTYDHDPLGRRIAKRIDGTTMEKYLWEGLNTLLAVYDPSDNLIQRFEYADDRTPVAMTQGGVTFYLAYDQVGTLRVVTDATGNVVKQIEYDTFGNILSDTNPSFTIPLGFAGGLHDRDIGLVRFGFRDYDPETGRWAAKDPIGFAGGDTDLYGYVQNNPVNLIDPLGLFDLYGYQNRGRGKGWETQYKFKFSPLKEKAGKQITKRLAKRLNRIAQVIDLINTKPVGPNHPYRDFLKLGNLDYDLEKEYIDRFGDKDRLTPDEASNFLNDMYEQYPELSDLYMTPEDMLNEAEKNSKDHWFYKLRPCE